MTRRRRLTLALVAVALLALGAVDLVARYRPRARPASPDVGTAAGRLFADPRYAFSAWIPYPHQNLGLLRREVFGDSDAAIAAALRLAGGGEPRLPPFGPFVLPPSRELAVAWNGPEDYEVVAEVFPLLGAFARFAGRLADNPWLRGGDLDDGERRLRVTWEGSRWSVRAGDAVSSPVPAVTLPPALAMVAVRREGEPLPAGLYRLEREDADWAVRSERPLPVDRRLDALELEGSRVVALQIQAGPPPAAKNGKPRRAASTPVRMWPETTLLFRGEMRFQPSLPRAAILHRVGSRRSQLPGEKLLEMLDRKPRHAREGDWSVYAHDRQGVGWTLGLLPRLGPLLEGPSPLARAAWVDLPAAEVRVSALVSALRSVPLVRRDTVARWSDLAAILRPLAAGYGTLALAVSEDPPAVEIDLRRAALPPSREVAEEADGPRADDAGPEETEELEDSDATEDEAPDDAAEDAPGSE